MISTNILITINATTLIAIIVFGIRILRFVDRIEFRVDIMWKDYEARIKALAVKAQGHAFNED